MTADSVLPYAFLIALLGFWIFLSTMFRIISGFSWTVSKEFARIRAVERVDSGSGCIRGIGFRSCLHVARLDNGFLLRLSPIFLGGSRFLADGDIMKAETRTSFFGGARLILSIRGETMEFHGDAMGLFVKHLAIPVDAGPPSS